MFGTTKAGGRVTCEVLSDVEGLVFLGIDGNAGTRKRYHTYPLTPREARNLANWLNGAADHVEKDTVLPND